MKHYITIELYLRDNKNRYKITTKEIDREDLFIFLMHIQGYCNFFYNDKTNCYHVEMTEANYNKTLESIEN